ncbi:hypothetical protein GCM10008171_19700 [Methylopila jiangsuensis]|uniref:Uncharacterized protein n=1 Tax=Methylopila jiangsuensis TaxID=586230 RepID=A0A9W6JHX0_9HYPH|nr:hypothetical protein [Methylopila jiangsuensis]MDR6286934.1 hypothetical protein [Methylopila jiangsuensis]GLK76716.1 hypothetical protein GCM10008171_19700 [Methylopila jiangsuensis]
MSNFNAPEYSPRVGRVQPKAAVSSRDHYEVYLTPSGWVMDHGGLRTLIGRTFAEAFRRLSDVAPAGVPGLVIGGE